VLYRGPWDEAAIRSLDGIVTSQLGGEREGYVVRLASNFHYRAFRQSVAKYVRKNHVQTDDHWALREVVPNKLREAITRRGRRPRGTVWVPGSELRPGSQLRKKCLTPDSTCDKRWMSPMHTFRLPARLSSLRMPL